MKVTVLGLWHLGSVTAACCAKHFPVVGLDFDSANVSRLQAGRAPIAEPGLDEAIQAGIAARRLSFTDDVKVACADPEILWVAYDTPVDADDRADVDEVLNQVRRCVPSLPVGALVLLSSQLPVGTCRQLEGEFGPRGYRFAVSPENLRLGQALEVFSKADRVVVGYRDTQARDQLATLFAPFTSHIVWMRPESAEMTKHAINSFLALSITFMNELSCLCERTKADAKEVEQGLKSESRIGPKAYLSPGAAFAGGTLARDVVTCVTLAEKFGEPLDLIPAIKRSNDRHRQWAMRKIKQTFPHPPSEPIALLGLTYKPGTDTLRRSAAVELAQALHHAGFKVTAHDPAITEVPRELEFVRLTSSAESLTENAAALVVCTQWPVFRERSNWPALIRSMSSPVVIDATRFLAKSLSEVTPLNYLSVGSPT
jgi:UDPglucose 6-dehydrogenase